MTALPHHVAVIDIGKTNAKLALVDRAAMVELAVLTRPNKVLPGPPYPHFDVDGHWQFILDGLAQFQASHGVDGISITTHGACAALLSADSTLIIPVLDYEHDGAVETTDAYDELRPAFKVTGSPRLGVGLNLGAQLHWLLARDPGLRQRVAHVVTWPQYWAHRLTGALACDLSSLGCHTDLWEPADAQFSPLVASLGLQGKMAQPMRPDAVLGPVLPAIASATGLAQCTPVVCGIHDSNASLLPHLLTQTGAFSVVSTGTWVVCMAVGGTAPAMIEARDVLVNVAADGRAVPSARFMGGREYELMRASNATSPTMQDEADVIASAVMLLPSVMPDGGPFPKRGMGWTVPTGDISSVAREVAVSFYLALMTAECLAMIGAAGSVIVEGPFAANPAFCRMLAAATGRAVLCAASQTGTSVGASLLFGAPEAAPPMMTVAAPENAADYRAYAEKWRATIGT